MKRILLVSSNISRDPQPVYPLGLSIVAAGLAESGHHVEQFDYLASGESETLFREKIASFDPDFVCVSLRNLDDCDSLSRTGYPEIARRLVGWVRETTGVPVIIGGPGYSILPEELLSFTGADHGVVGEGERIVCELIRDLSEGRTPPPIVRGDTLLDGSEMPSPRYNGEMIAYYLDQGGMLNLQTKRGCPHDCMYCIYPALEGNRFRFRDTSAVVDDIARAGVEHGVESFFFTDSIFNDPQGRYLSIAEEILRRDLRIRWCCYMRPERIGRKEFALLKRAGLYAVELGTDAACDSTLRSMGKGFLFSDAIEVNRACVAERLPCAHFVMFGGPGETIDTVREGLENLQRLEHTVVFAYSGIRILPGTALHRRAIAEGVLSPGASLVEPAYYLSPEVDAEEMNRMISDSFRGRRDRIFPPGEGRKRLTVLHAFGYRGLLWDHLIRFPKDPGC
jgi:lipid biosynthesis B12-binding/radical SAM protein